MCIRDRRHIGTGQLLRGCAGDTLYDGVRIASISDDAVTVVGADGRRFIFQGRFPAQ